LRIPGERIFNNLDGIRFLTHQGGCGGTRQERGRRCASSRRLHPPSNVAGATV